MNRPQLDLTQLLEALYDLEQPRDVWTRGVLAAACARLARGAGIGMAHYDVSGPALDVEAIDGVNLTAGHLAVGARTHATPRWADDIVHCYQSDVCATLGEHMQRTNDGSWSVSRPTFRRRIDFTSARKWALFDGSLAL